MQTATRLLLAIFLWAGLAAAATAADDTQPAGDPLARHQTSDLKILVLHHFFDITVQKLHLHPLKFSF